MWRVRWPYGGIALRWKVLQIVGSILIGLAVLIDWGPALDPGLPSTSSFLLILGLLVGGAGWIAQRLE